MLMKSGRASRCFDSHTNTGWIFPGSKKEQVVRVLRADPSNEVEEGAAAAQLAAKAKKNKDDFIDDDDDSD